MFIHVLVLLMIALAETADVIKVDDMTLNTRSFSLFSVNSRSLKYVLRLPSDVDLLKTNVIKTAQGIEKSRLKELFKGKRVTGAGVEARIDAFGNYVDGAVTGTVVVNIEQDLPPVASCRMTKRQALIIVLKTEGLSLNEPITELVISETIFIDELKVAHRAYEVDLFVIEQERHPFYTIDKCTGIVLDNFNKMVRFTVPTAVTDVLKFSTGLPTIPTDSTLFTQPPATLARFGVTSNPPTNVPTPFVTNPSPSRNPIPTSVPLIITQPTNGPNPTTGPAPIYTQATATPAKQANTQPTPTSPKQVNTQPPPTSPKQVNTQPPPTSPKQVNTQPPTSSPNLVTNPTATDQWNVQSTAPPRITRQTSQQLTTPTPTIFPNTSPFYSSFFPSTTLLTTNPPPSGGCPTPATGLGGNTKTQQYQYGIPPRCLNPTVSGDMCLLENEFVKVVDLQGARYITNPPTANFTCTQGYSDAVNGAFSPALDAYFFATISGRVLKEWYGHKQDLKPVVQVHYGRNVDNAFYNPNSNVLTFGDGNWLTYPLVSLDVVSHELAHGITTQHSNLRYKGESGGIDEAFSDMAGEVAESFFSTNDWLVGADLVKTDGGAFRYFADPSQDGNSINHVDLYKWNMDVHFSSGIYNYAFYRMVNIYNIDIRHAYEAFLNANLLYWKSNDGFTDAACGVVRGAYDAGIDVTDVTSAFADVGITVCDINTVVEKLDPAAVRSDLQVSSSVQPLFRFAVANAYTGVLLTAWSLTNEPITIAISTSLSRNGGDLQTSVESLTYILPTETPRKFFVRLATDTTKIISKVSLSIQFI